jgi:hypothetical protein
MSDEVFSDGFNIWQAQFMEQEALQVDHDLRQAGFPQILLNSLRSSGLSSATLQSLPIPAVDTYGNLKDEWWQELKAKGVPDAALPQRFRSTSTPSPDVSGMTRAEKDLHAYSTAQTQFNPSGTAGSARIADPDLTLNFGTPVLRAGRTTPHGPPHATSVSRVLFPPGLNASAQTPSPSGAFTSAGSATPFGSQVPAPAPGVDYLKGIAYAIPVGDWPSVRDPLISSGTCKVFKAFSYTDKQFQSTLNNVRIPYAMKDVGKSVFTPDAWRDLREALQALDVWNLFCAILCGNFRVVLDGDSSMSMAANEVARILESAPSVTLHGHSELTTSLTHWHATYVLNEPTLVYASLASVVLRDRIIRMAILAAVNADAKTYLRATFPRDDAVFPLYIATLHSWCARL